MQNNTSVRAWYLTPALETARGFAYHAPKLMFCVLPSVFPYGFSSKRETARSLAFPGFSAQTEQPWPGSMCCAVWQNTLFPQFGSSSKMQIWGNNASYTSNECDAKTPQDKDILRIRQELERSWQISCFSYRAETSLNKNKDIFKTFDKTVYKLPGVII